MSTAVIAAAPCAKCPFRKDVPIYLRRSRRVEIAEALLTGGAFACHATVEYGEDDEGESYSDDSDAAMCAGAAKALLVDGTSSNLMRVMDRLGAVDLERTAERGVDVWGLAEWQSLAEGSTAEAAEVEYVETCNTVNDGCLAPAGYAMGGGIVEGDEPADGECATCGEGLCSNCADDNGNCGMCSGWGDE